MILRGIDFGHVWGQSGVQGFFGEGYPYHKYFKSIGLTFKNCTFVAKTTTVPPRIFPEAGKMPMQKDGITPGERVPKCVYVNPLKGVALNAVGLNGPGFEALLDHERWQKHPERFMISYMSAEQTEQARLQETRSLVELLRPRLGDFRCKFAIQRNYSCPNVGATPRPPKEFIQEVWMDLNILQGLGVPIVVKFSVTTSVSIVHAIATHPACDAVLVSNTIPWGELKDRIDWKGLFGSEVSPLMKRVGLPGGLSGAPLLPIVVDWLKEARGFNFPKPIAAGGGILGPKDVDCLIRAGARAICVGSMSMLRPWWMQATINRANRLLIKLS